MSDLASRIANLSPEKRAVLERRLQQQQASATKPSGAEALALIGIGCRFPGGISSVESFWRLIADGGDAITETPRERWPVDELYDPNPDAPGKVNTRWGGFVDEVDKFDAGLFGISPSEAVQMDPQQRVLLETAWDALEHAGQAADRLKGSRTGVFVGAHSHSSDYALMQYRQLDSLDKFSGTGTAHNFLSGRLSYVLDLHGPSLVVDTACSSSLVATHLACQSLRLGECRMALVAGVNLILGPFFSVAASRMHMLSPSGRCRTFDSRADGFVRSEGCGVVVLKRLVDAVADGDRVLAVIRGTAMNQDGRTNGITAPNGLSQQAVVREALRNGGVEPSSVGYVETHGTATALGDPIEVEALGAVLGPGRAKGATVTLGAVKSNLGHLEGAAGIAALIKTTLCLVNRKLPPVVHFKQLNPHISLDGTPFVIPTSTSHWECASRRIAGVSAFSWSGTNAHVVLEEAPEDSGSVVAPGDRGGLARLLPFSARGEDALDALGRAWRLWLTMPRAPQPFADVCHSAACRRTHHEWRAAVIADAVSQLPDRFDAFLRRTAHPHVSIGRAEARSGIVFIIPDRPSRDVGMGRELYASEPVFRDAIDRCERALAPHVDWSIAERFRAAADAPPVPAAADAASRCFALPVALDALWRSWGIAPDAVIADGIGEAAAACVAGALALDDAARAIGHWAASFASEKEDGAGSDAMRRRALEGLQPQAARVPIYAGGATAVARVTAEGDGTFIELSVPTLRSDIEHMLRTLQRPGLVLSSLQPGESERVAMLRTAAQLYAAGHDLNWTAVNGPGGFVELPRYQFQRQRYWMNTGGGDVALHAAASGAQTEMRDELVEPRSSRLEPEATSATGRVSPASRAGGGLGG
jgi:acyl transferase domain-containing protein